MTTRPVPSTTRNSTVKYRSGSPVGSLCPAPALISVSVKVVGSPGRGCGGGAGGRPAHARFFFFWSGAPPPNRPPPPPNGPPPPPPPPPPGAGAHSPGRARPPAHD